MTDLEWLAKKFYEEMDVWFMTECGFGVAEAKKMGMVFYRLPFMHRHKKSGVYAYMDNGLTEIVHSVDADIPLTVEEEYKVVSLLNAA